MSQQDRSSVLKNVLVAAGDFDPSAPTTSITFAPGRVVSVPTALLLESLNFQEPESAAPAAGSLLAVPAAAVTSAAAETASGPVPTTIPLIAEELVVAKRVVPLETVRVVTGSEQVIGSAEVDLIRERWEVSRVPIDREVDVRTEMRVEDETSIYPVFEERLVARKVLFLSEEVHIRRVIETRHEKVEADLRRDVVTVERNAQQE